MTIDERMKDLQRKVSEVEKNSDGKKNLISAIFFSKIIFFYNYLLRGKIFRGTEGFVDSLFYSFEEFLVRYSS